MNEPEMSRTARAGGDTAQTGGLAEGSGAGTGGDLLVSGGRGLADLLPRRLVTGWARGRSLMRVRALQAQPDPRSRPRRRRWLPIAGDAALALALAAAFYLATRTHYDYYEQNRGIALILLQTLPLAFRRWYPVGVLAVVVAATLATMATEIPGRPNGGVGVVLLVALYSVAAHCPRRQAAWAGIAAGAALAWPLWTATAGIAPLIARVQIAVVSLVLPALGWLSGAYMSELRARAARSRREQELETGRAVAEEQARVGRELHDVIAHTLSVIIIQAGAAEDVFDTRPQAARQALGSIGAAGRQALAELRRVLAAVRPQAGEQEGWAPQPGLSGLGELLAQVRAAGLTVTARVDGAPADLPAGLDLAAYRIVQEALTNTLKHARAQAAEVNLRYRPAGLFLEVTDDGQPAAPAGPAPGRGLIGIRERAALHGGTCQAGPRPCGGFAVRVSLPLDASGRAGTVASGTALMPPRQTAALKETALSLPAQPDPRSRPRWRRWLLVAGDAALALALAAMAVAEPWPPGPGRAAGIALALLQTLPLAVRRWRPVGVLAVVAAAALGAAIARDGGGLGPVCVLVALYSVAAHCPRRQAAWAGIAAWAALTWPLLREGGGPGGPQQIGLAAAISLGFPALAWLSGAYVSELRDRAARSRREQELETGRAVAEEQARVGRELHDVIAHTLSVIIIQAGAAEDVFGTRPQAARQALGSIGAAGRQALAELRRVLAAVRPQAGEQEGWAPQPGLSGLGELLAQVRATGLHVTARIDGAPADLPAGLDLAAYRIVQEALTNTLKHARAQAAEVNLRYSPAGLVLEVTDDGRPAAPAGPRGPAPGRGLIGIRERAALHGGTCQAGPRPGGGFGVRVSLPLPGDGLS